jgi:hypothetical protein
MYILTTHTNNNMSDSFYLSPEQQVEQAIAFRAFEEQKEQRLAEEMVSQAIALREQEFADNRRKVLEAELQTITEQRKALQADLEASRLAKEAEESRFQSWRKWHARNDDFVDQALPDTHADKIYRKNEAARQRKLQHC